MKTKGKASNYGIDKELLEKKFEEAMADFTGASHKGWAIGSQLNTIVLVKEFEMNGATFQCLLTVTKDEDEFID